jgi:hypothetical protein
MSVESIKAELSNLSAEDRRELVAFLVHLNRRQSASAAVRSLADILDDQRPGQWLTLDAADRRLDWLPEPA